MKKIVIGNLVLRALTAPGRFFLFFITAKLLSINDVAAFALVMAAAIIATFLYGLEYYNYSIRECIKSTNPNDYIANHGTLGVVSVLIITPIVVVTIRYFQPDLSILELFVCVVFFITEYISLEIYRYLNALKETISANILLFFKNGVASYFITSIILIFPDFRNLKMVLLLLAISGVLATFAFLRKLLEITKFKFRFASFSRSQVIKGLSISRFYLVNVIVLKLIEQGDRFLVKKYFTDATVSAYAFFMMLGYQLQTIVYTGAVLYFLPKLVEGAVDKTTKSNERKSIIEFWQLVAGIVVVFVLFAYVFGIYISKWLGKNYVEHSHLFIPILILQAINAFALVPHYILYSHNQDKYLVFSTTIGFISILIVLAFTPINNAKDIINALIIGAIAAFAVKQYGSSRILVK